MLIFNYVPPRAPDKQQSIRFVNQMEVRVNKDIPLERCSVFFRNEKLADVDEGLNNKAIFQLPFTAEWYRDHFLCSQKWYWREDGDMIEFFDNRVCNYSTEQILEALKKTLDQF